MRLAVRTVLGAALTGLVAACAGQPDLPAGGDEWSIEVVADGLENPWDVGVLPDGSLLVPENDGRLQLVSDGQTNEVNADLDDVDGTGEGGLMGLVLDPNFGDSNRFYTCQSTDADVRVVAWTLAADGTSAERDPEPLVSGIDRASSGRHSGCRLLFDDSGALLVSAGDAAVGSNPQDLGSLNGKVLRVDPQTGNPAEGNPGLERPEIYTYGHRNVQGLALQPGTGEVYAVEHGPDRDDEINLLSAGGNYGWNPDGDGSYDESVPMTDDQIDGAIPAIWSSGSPTVAASGAAFLDGSGWGDDEGLLAVACLKGARLLLIDVAADQGGEVRSVPGLEDDYGRLRAVVPSGDGSIYVTTSNGTDDKVLLVSP
ncbi:PQQ-dependent sugar dehydrogenase [Epidermidibacterium keratini]|uniref:PQQ-dependent sugar dehydrogenase n=1 Tax=Epidermidibacterium keratini TaxID=1891644 RepID=A0A7L4YKM2_9ACTN|nr:PQQ-dependent sugar dehydrogenase [Epidermidibacterium keratini]QHB99393.1 PQQ-dependent sugar dehydrogenase [Epidermidibacterium keratini]